jgi:tetratricopeptide (TPR) repeat protein
MLGPLTAAGKVREAAEQLRQSLYSGLPASLPLAGDDLGAARGVTPQTQKAAAQAQLQLAVRLRQAGRTADATAALERAVRLEPANPIAHHRLGVALLDANQLAPAAAALRQAVALNETSSAAHYHLGIALHWLGQEDAAIEAYRRTVAIAPKSADAWSRLGNLLSARGALEQAIACFRNAAGAAPHSTLGRMNRAKALVVGGQTAEAETALRRAIALDPENAETHRLLGNLLAEGGRFVEAAAALKRTIELNPGEVTAWGGLVGTRKLAEADRPLIAQMLECLKKGRMTEPMRMKLHFALGKAYDDLGDYAEAMEQFDAANRIKHRLVPFDRNAFARRVDELVSTFTPSLFAHHAGIGNDDETPVLILGMPRSGTTLVEQILSSHPSVGGGGELPFWSERAPALEQALREKTEAGMIPRIAADYLSLLRGLARGATRVTDKLPYNFLWIGLIRLVFPRAFIIHCRREPVDTCLSIYTTNFASPTEFSSDRGDLAFYYEHYRRLMAHWRNVLSPERFFEVDYEALTADPEPATRRLISFVGLTWDAACLRPEANPRVVKTASVWQARQPIYRTAVARWRRYEPWLGELRQLLPQPESAP